MSDLKVGSIVYHKPGKFIGPGTVTQITVLGEEGAKPIHVYGVDWGDGVKWGHFRRNLLTSEENR